MMNKISLGENLNKHFQENLKYYWITCMDSSMNHALYNSRSIYYNIRWDLIDKMEVYLWNWIRGAVGRTLRKIWI